MEVGEILKKKVVSKLGEVIDSKGLRRDWVARQIEATPAQITNWCTNENGFAKSTPSVLYMLRLEKLLKVTVSDMYEEYLIDEETK